MTLAEQTSETPSCHWDGFIQTLQEQTNKKFGAEYSVQAPYEGVQDLVNKYFDHRDQKHILDIGCELGKNSLPFLEKGHRVTLLDISSIAIEYTTANLKQRNLYDKVFETMQLAIEFLPIEKRNYDAVVGTYTFPFIPQHLFDIVMKNNVLDRVKPGGYFTGGFWGEKHSWAKKPGITVSTEKSLRELFRSMNFEILQFDVIREERQSVHNGTVLNHEFRVIARRRRSIEFQLSLPMTIPK